MTVRTRAVLKNWQIAGAKPAAGDIYDLIESQVHITEDLATVAEAKTGSATDKFLSPAILKQGSSLVAPMFAQHYQIAPALQTATYVHAAVTLGTGVTTTVTTAITAPDVPRNVTVKGNQASIAGNVVVTGTNINDEAITDTIALNEATEVAGAVAFKSVTSILLPARTSAGDTVSIGVGVKLGLPHIVEYATLLLVALFDGSADTGGTLAVDADEIEKNLYTLAGTADGAKLVDLYYLV